jgi:hypothetical protein
LSANVVIQQQFCRVFRNRGGPATATIQVLDDGSPSADAESVPSPGQSEVLVGPNRPPASPDGFDHFRRRVAPRTGEKQKAAALRHGLATIPEAGCTRLTSVHRSRMILVIDAR